MIVRRHNWQLINDPRIGLLEYRVLQAKAVSDPLVWVEVDLAERLLHHEAERDFADFSFTPETGTVSIFDTLFSSTVLENFKTSSGEDECYQHVRREDGAVMIVRTHGHREQIRRLRQCLDARPRTSAEWNSDVELVLATSPDAIAREAVLLDDLVRTVQAFRQSAQPPASEDNEQWRVAQMTAAAEMFAALERVSEIRSQLFAADAPIPEVDVHADGGS